MNWLLIVDRGRHKGKAIRLRRSPFWIGRAAACSLRLESREVAQRHCALLAAVGCLFVHCDSDGETLVNGGRVWEETELREGDRITIGPLEFVVRQESLSPSLLPLDDALGQWLLATEEDGTSIDASPLVAAVEAAQRGAKVAS